MFMVVATAADRVLALLPWLEPTPVWLGGGKGLLWLVTVLVAMSSLIAAVRKLEALAVLLAGTSAGPRELTGRSAATVQLIVSRVIFWGGTGGLGVWILAVSATVLPPWPGLLVLLCAVKGDRPADVDHLVRKVSQLRIFADSEGRMSRSVLDQGGGMLVVSHFTLAASTRKGTRPSFDRAEDLFA